MGAREIIAASLAAIVWLIPVVIVVYVFSRLRWLSYDLRKLRMDLEELRREIERTRK